MFEGLCEYFEDKVLGICAHRCKFDLQAKLSSLIGSIKADYIKERRRLQRSRRQQGGKAAGVKRIDRNKR